MSNKIQFILAIPYNEKYYRYYINNNFEDKHLLKRDDFYFFVADLVKSPLPAKIRKLIDYNRNFVIDTKNNDVVILSHDNTQERINLKKQNTQNIVKKWKKEKREKEKKENKKNFYDGNLLKIYKQFNIK